MEKDDVALIHSVLSGDETAFSALVKKYQKGVHALVWRKIGDFHIAEEITQDAFLQAHKKLASLKDPRSFPGWLYVIADRLCRAWFREKQLKNTQSLETISENVLEKTDYANYVLEEREAEAVEHQREIVQRLMAKLPESERTVMVLYYLGEMNCEEISRFLGVSPNTVKSRLRRARERLKNEEHIIHECFGSVTLHPNLTKNIMRNIDEIKQTSPSGGKPLLPFAALGSSVILVILFLGANHQYIARSHQPYSLDAQSEPTIEIIDAPIVLKSQSKRDLQNRVGNETTPGRNSNDGLSEGTQTVENNLTRDPMQWNLPEDAKARIGKGKINAIQYSPDGKLFAVASGIGIWLYDVATRREIALLTEHTSVVDRLAFSPDGRTFASGSKDGTILLWGYNSIDGSTSVQTKLTIDRRELSALNLTFSPDGKVLASGTGGIIQFWDTIIGEQKDTLTGLPENIGNLSFNPDNKTIVSVTWDGEVCISDTITGKPKKIFTVRMTDSAFSIAFSPDGEIVAIGGRDGIIYLSNLKTGELKRKLTGHSVDVQSIVFSPDGKTVASSSYIDETVRIWDVHTGEHRQTLTGHTWDISSLAFSPDGKTLASGGSGDGGIIRLWDVHTGTEKYAVTGHTGFIDDFAFSSNGRTIIIGYADGAIRLWDVYTRQHVKTYNKFRDAMSNGAIGNIAFTPDGKTLVWGKEGMGLWDADTDEHKMILTSNEWGNHSLELSPDGKIIAVAFGDNLIKLWDMNTGEQRLTFAGHTEDIFSLAFSPDSKILASTSDDNTIRLWDAQTGENTEVFTLDSAWRKDVADWRIDSSWCGVAFSPDGKTLAGGGGEIVLLWDIDTGKTKRRLIRPTHRVFDLAFSPDGKTLASGGFERNINLWDPHTGEHKKTLTGHTAWVRSIAFSPDGKTLASRSDDGTVLLWDMTRFRSKTD